MRRFIHAWKNGGRWKILGTFTLAAAVMALTSVVWYVRTPAPIDNLGPFPVQEVDLPVEMVVLPTVGGTRSTSSLPTLHVAGNSWPDLPVSGTKCYAASITVQGEVNWQSVDPLGTQVAAGQGVGHRNAGCTAFNFRNPIPNEVRARVIELSREGQNVTIWQVNGHETESGVTSVTEAWQTENFAIVYDGEQE